MKMIIMSLVMLCASLAASAKTKHYEPEWKSITTHEIPTWALDEKFGIYAHWGPYSILGEWEDNKTFPTYGNRYLCGYIESYSPDKENAFRVAFEKRYGSIEDGNGYYDLCADFSASKFDPAAWAELVKDSGAGYAGMCAIHHDGYMMWDSEINDFCAGKLGAKRDLLGDLFKELEKRDIKTIASFHHNRTDNMFKGIAGKLVDDKSYAGCDLIDPNLKSRYWFMGSREEFCAKEVDIAKELINNYTPDVIWFDGGVTNGIKEVTAEFLNMGVREDKEVVLHNKLRMFGDDFGVFSYERGYSRPYSLMDHPWEDDDTSSLCGSWSWWHGITYKTSSDIIKRICHMSSINGGLLLSLNPRPDGSFDQQMIDQLKQIGVWMKQNGEAINGTRPWKFQGEGHMDEHKLRYEWSIDKPQRYATPNTKMFTDIDFRFTSKKDAIYALQLGIPKSGKAVIKTLSNKNIISSENDIISIELLGHGEVPFERNDDACVITLPAKLPNNVVLAYKIKLKGDIEQILFKGR